MRELTHEEQEQAVQLCYEGQTLTKVAETLGFNTVMGFLKYRERNPEFNARLSAARAQACEILEDQILEVVDVYPDPKAARVKLDSLCRALAYKNPARYGARVDVNITERIDIGSSLSRAENVLNAAYRDVSPLQIAGITELF